ncbi:hypothetical protein ACWD7C_31895 [Streptomyces sp. NPDC005134]|uniref:hypothetical protein n=1 Tax=unclassified Streptomyces TaxID=2593676 RepID=UPI0033AE104C
MAGATLWASVITTRALVLVFGGRDERSNLMGRHDLVRTGPDATVTRSDAPAPIGP